MPCFLSTTFARLKSEYDLLNKLYDINNATCYDYEIRRR
jgi:hypothetical protein